MANNQMTAHDNVVEEIVAPSCEALVSSIVAGDASYRDFARSVNEYFTKVYPGMNMAWYEADRTDKSDFAKDARAQMATLKDKLKERMPHHTNPAQVILRVKDYAKQEHDKDARAELSGEDELIEAAGNGAKPQRRSPELRFSEELIKLYKFGMSSDALGEKCDAALEHVKTALVALGIEPGTIKLK